MDCAIDWSTSKVEQRELSVELRPAPDFAFMVKFDQFLSQHASAAPGRSWGEVMLAHGHVVISDVEAGSAPALRAFLDDAVQTANELAVEERQREAREADTKRAAEERAAEEKRDAADAKQREDAALAAEFRDPA